MTYLLGLLTLPVTVALVWVIRVASKAASRRWTEHSPRVFTEPKVEQRAHLAARFMLARRFFWVGLPGGQLVVYRSHTAEPGPTRDRAWRIEMDLRRSVAAAQELDR